MVRGMHEQPYDVWWMWLCILMGGMFILTVFESCLSIWLMLIWQTPWPRARELVTQVTSSRLLLGWYCGSRRGMSCTKVIGAYAPLATKKELMHFLEWVGFYHCFWRNFSTSVAPFTPLLKAKVRYVWSTVDHPNSVRLHWTIGKHSVVMAAPHWATVRLRLMPAMLVPEQCCCGVVISAIFHGGWIDFDSVDSL